MGAVLFNCGDVWGWTNFWLKFKMSLTECVMAPCDNGGQWWQFLDIKLLGGDGLPQDDEFVFGECSLFTDDVVA